jgi:hypothetical protein
MGLPAAAEARPYYRSAKQRFTDAELLLEGGRTTGAIYLAGYTVECMLKALLLSLIPQGKRQEMLQQFRGSRAHDFEWLQARYYEYGGPRFPADTQRDFVFVNTWDTQIRYESGTARPRDAEAFLNAVQRIVNWAEGRL